MNATAFADSRPFGIGTRTEIRLHDDRLVTLSVRAGDLLRSEGGLVWATIDGEADDILLERGDVHTVARDCEMRVSAFGLARLDIYGHGPLRFECPERHPLRAALASLREALVSRLGRAPLGARAPIDPVHAA